MTGPVTIVHVPPVGRRLQDKTRRRGALVKALCRDRRQPLVARVVILVAWALRTPGVQPGWLHVSRNGTPHYDLWGRWAR